MASDEVMLHAALDGTASLRFYGWSPPTLSLGYFQPESVRRADPLLTDLPFVRRPSGGSMLVHHHELTYALALPAGAPWQSRDVCCSWVNAMHLTIRKALRDGGNKAYLIGGKEGLSKAAPHNESPLCFHHFTLGDVCLAGAKIVGSAQRKRHGALLQHGAILLQRSAHAPTLPGIFELAGRHLEAGGLARAICQEFTRRTGWALVPRQWDEFEVGATIEIARTKYRSDAWNRKR
jgi:lipoate-protein ligase A